MIIDMTQVVGYCWKDDKGNEMHAHIKCVEENADIDDEEFSSDDFIMVSELANQDARLTKFCDFCNKPL